MRRVLLCFAVALAGCASSGVVKIDRDVYMLTKQSGGGAFGSPAALLADLYQEAAAYCSKTGQQVESVNETETPGIPFVRIAAAQLRFRCVLDDSRR